MKPGDPAYEKGVRFLRGTDQFISAAATDWATMALAHAVRCSPGISDAR